MTRPGNCAWSHSISLRPETGPIYAVSIAPRRAAASRSMPLSDAASAPSRPARVTEARAIDARATEARESIAPLPLRHYGRVIHKAPQLIAFGSSPAFRLGAPRKSLRLD